MSISEKKRAALRANAQKSTGPRTPDGKRISSLNSTKHGFSAKQLHIPDHLKDAFTHHRHVLFSDIHPTGGAELDLFERCLHASWCLFLIEQAEIQILGDTLNPFSDSNLALQLERLARYRSTHERTYRQNLKLIRELQTDRVALQSTDQFVQAFSGREYPMARYSHLSKRSNRILDRDVTEDLRSFMSEELERLGLDPDMQISDPDETAGRR